MRAHTLEFGAQLSSWPTPRLLFVVCTIPHGIGIAPAVTMSSGPVVTEGEILAGKYKVERVLAQGGMGVVVAAFHTQLEQRVALKFLLPTIGQDEQIRTRFLREARAAVRLRSEHVARVLDVGTAETGSPYIVMEYLEGMDLSTVLLEEKRLSVEQAATYLLQAAEAVAEAHACGIIHRDLKPANLFLTMRSDGTPCVKVLDFGISKTADASVTTTAAMMGTPHYMSPEQLRSASDVDVRSDIWAMGMILHELLTGQVAFRRDTLPELCASIVLDDVPSITDAFPEVSRELEAVVMKALSKAPVERQQNLAELANELAPFSPEGPAAAKRIARVLAGRDSDASVRTMLSSRRGSSPDLAVEAAKPVTPQPVVKTVAYATPAPPLPAVDEELPIRKSNAPLIAVFAGCLAIAVVILVFAFRKSPPVATSATSVPTPLAFSEASPPPPPPPPAPPTMPSETVSVAPAPKPPPIKNIPKTKPVDPNDYGPRR